MIWRRLYTESMIIAVDIDGTIARRNVAQVTALCNERLALGIEPARLARLTYKELLATTEFTAYQDRVGETAARHELTWLDLDPASILAKLPLPGAVEAVARLADIGDIAYYTARHTEVPKWQSRNEPMAIATHQWLTAHSFVNPDRVVFCASLAEKLQRLADLATPAMIIDDHPQLATEYAALHCPAVHIVHFRTSVTTTYPVLWHWNDIDVLIQKGIFDANVDRISKAYPDPALARLE